jgi:hypothetical protein
LFTVSATVTTARVPTSVLEGYIAGYVDGEGSFSVSVQRNKTCWIGFQLIPEFHVSQNGERAEVLELIRGRFGCGYIKPNSRQDQALVYVVRERRALMEVVIPFLERVPLISSKRTDFDKFAHVVNEMAQSRHRTLEGFRSLLDIALSMNGGGRHRQVRWSELLANERLDQDERTQYA